MNDELRKRALRSCTAELLAESVPREVLQQALRLQPESIPDWQAHLWDRTIGKAMAPKIYAMAKRSTFFWSGPEPQGSTLVTAQATVNGENLTAQAYGDPDDSGLRNHLLALLVQSADALTSGEESA